MKEIAEFLVPLAWLLPLVVAVTNRVKALGSDIPPAALIVTSMAVGTIAVGVAVYFPVMPMPLRVAVAGVALGLSASGVFDLFKTFGTITTTSETGDE